MPDAVTHPTRQELAAFGLGKLSERAAAAVASHLESCAACRQAVAGVSADSFLGKVRDACKDGSSFPPSAARPENAPSSAGLPAMPVVACSNVPPELVRHPKYLILRELGRGGMGVVYQARQTMMNRPVVIKVINRSLLERPGALERFRREIQAAAQLSHPNIVTAYDAEQAGELHMLVMEFVPGQSLAEVLERKGPLPVANACHYMRQVALGLQHAHERGMVHRDIKPNNLILMPKSQVKILDFGLAKVISERVTGTGTGLTDSGDYMGTPDYSSPEQAKDARTADIRADLYSLGCALYCLLAGRPPFHEDTAVNTILAHIQKEPQPLPELRPDVPAELWQVVTRLLAKAPAQRYQKPIEVFRALSVFVKPGAKLEAKGSSVPAPSAGSPAKGTRIAADASQIKKILREMPGKTPPKKVPAKEEAFPFENLIDSPALPRKAKGGRESTKRVPAGWYRRWPMLAGVGVLLLALLGMWVGGVFKVKVKAADGEAFIVLEIDQPGAEVLVDGHVFKVNVPGENKPIEVKVEPGKHRVEVKKDGFKAKGEEVTLENGGRRIIRVAFEKMPPPPPALLPGAGNAQVPPDGKLEAVEPRPAPGEGQKERKLTVTHHRPGWVEEKWLREVSTLPAEQQVVEVRNTLQARNPGFDGTVKHRSEQGVVTEFEFNGEAVHDISPLLVFSGLRKLDCSCKDPWLSPLGDLSPLSGLPLRSLRYPYHTWLGAKPLRSIKTLQTVNDQPEAEFWKTVKAEAVDFENYCKMVAVRPPQAQQKAVADRLKERNPGFDGEVTATVEDGVVTGLQFMTDQVTDISPVPALTGLRTLKCYASPGGERKLADLLPLKDMRLTHLDLTHTRVSDLSPLKDMKLTELTLTNTRVSDLSPLKDMKLTHLSCSAFVSDLSPLKDMKLTGLNCWAAPVSDLSPLEDMKLTHLLIPGTRVSDLSPLKGMPLKEVVCDFRPERDAEILRSIKTLEKINDKPVAQFWKEVDNRNTSGGSPPAPK